MKSKIKMQKRSISRNSFQTYVDAEREIRNEAWVRRDYIEGQNRLLALREKQNGCTFAETYGAVKIFSMLEASNNFDNARKIYSEDRYQFAQSLLRDMAKRGNYREMADSPSVAAINNLEQNFPNFSEVIQHIRYAAALSRLTSKSWFQMRPILLLGNPGVGKTAFVQAFADILGVPFKRLDVGSMSGSASIAGLSFSWSTGNTGEMLRLMIESSYANPMVMLDEVDKIGSQQTYPLEPVLLSLLEPESAASFRDEGLMIKMNLSHMIWLATANEAEHISEPLRSRFTIINVNAPSSDQLPAIVRSIYQKIRSNNPWGTRFPEMIQDQVIERLMAYSPRQLHHILTHAFGSAALRGECDITVKDLPHVHSKSATRMGFV